ncbi:hypothetical protein AB0H83_49790 [Dactylosporangium sp. NPDC050688]|uniref:5'-methylthioadenosine/S-adenosylhomocysteine nucleosidase family protein n=1 Tax=Dactylosporangium sp. NPDC050688 TaxID=3157217 RepID=UPI0033C841D9
MLYVAARDGRLIWRGPGSFALLLPPADAVVRHPPGARLGLLRALDRRWEVLATAAPPGVALLAALPLVAWVDAAAGQLLIVTTVLYLAVLTAQLVVSRRRHLHCAPPRPHRPAGVAPAACLPRERWSMVLCHETDQDHADELLRAVDRHLSRLIRLDLQRRGDNRGAALLGSTAPETLACRRAGVTTVPMRARVARWSGGEMADPAALRATAGGTHRPQRFAFWFFAGATALVLVMAAFVPSWERAACEGTGCAGRPTSYPSALRWLAQRLSFTDPPGLSPGSSQAWGIGWFTSLLTPVGVCVLTAAVIIRFHRARRTELTRIRATDDVLHQATTVLLMVATTTERTAVLAAVGKVTGVEPEVQFVQSQTVFRLGRISNADILLVQTTPGAVGPSSAAITAAALIQTVTPDYIILTGLCFGLRPRTQELGDVIVSAQMRAIDHRKVVDHGDDRPPMTLVRGDLVSASTRLTSSFTMLAFDFDDTKVHYGTMLSSSTLVNSRQLVDELLRIDPEAQGGEMEGAGVYAAAAPEKTDWIIVKGICDWGHGKTDDAQRLAAANAAAFVVHVIRHGAMDESPRRRAAAVGQR